MDDSCSRRDTGALQRLQGRAAVKCLAVALIAWFTTGSAATAYAEEVEKVLFLVVEKTGVYASNALTGRIDRLELRAKERIEDYQVANAVAVVVTNQRYAAYGVLPGGWQSVRVRAQEETESVEVGDYSATVVTSDRILNFYGRRGAWSEIRRAVE
jgi:hypothetical protein